MIINELSMGAHYILFALNKKKAAAVRSFFGEPKFPLISLV